MTNIQVGNPLLSGGPTQTEPGFEDVTIVNSASKSPLVILELHESKELIHIITGHETSSMVVEPMTTTVDDTL